MKKTLIIVFPVDQNEVIYFRVLLQTITDATRLIYNYQTCIPYIHSTYQLHVNPIYLFTLKHRQIAYRQAESISSIQLY